MTPAVLLVDDQRDILRLLRSALETLKNPNLEILEASSAEAALQLAGDRQVDLLITDYNLPDLTGIELTHRMRAGQPDMRVILITATTDRQLRDEMLNAGAVAVFSKPVPLGDFLDAVERGLSLARTILPAESEGTPGSGGMRVSELLANFRQDVHADAAFLISNRGLVAARAGDLRDSSMEVSLISALNATSAAGLKVADSNRQPSLQQFSVFAGGDQDLILMPVDASYSLLLAGGNLADHEALPDTLRDMKSVSHELAKSLRQIGAEVLARRRRGKTGELPRDAPEIDALLNAAPETNLGPEELDAYWEAAAAQHSGKPVSKDVIPYDEARRLGLTPDAEK